MKRYEFKVETANGKERTVVLEGNTAKDAAVQFRTQKLVTDLASGRMINVDFLVEVEAVGEVKNEVGN